MGEGTFTVSRAAFMEGVRSDSVRFDNEYMEAVEGDSNAFRFFWRWSWRRMWWVPFDAEVHA